MFRPKFDLNQVRSEQRMYLLLKAICEQFQAFPVLEQEWFTSELIQDAHTAVAEFEADWGPLAEGVVCKNFGGQYIVGAQLFTTNGRHCGNGWLVHIPTKPSEDCETYYHILTDAGSPMRLNRRELERAFEAGDWISDPARIIADFDRHGHYKDLLHG